MNKVTTGSGSRTQNSMFNMVYGLINKIVTMILSLVGRSIFLWILPVEYLGINGVFSDILGMLSLTDLGIATAMAYSFYKPLAENDVKKLTALVTFYRRVYHIIAATVAVLGLCLVPFLDKLINVDYEIPHLTFYYLISLFNTVVSYLLAYKQSLITADQKFYLINKYSMYIAFAKIIFQTLVLYITRDYTCYLLVGVVTTVAYNLLVNHQANKYYPFVKESEKLDDEERKKILKDVWSVFVYKVGGVILTGTDNTLISIIVNTAAVGLYTNYMTIINRIVAFSDIIFSSITASVGNFVAKENKDDSFKIFKSIQLSAMLVAGFIVVELYFLTHDFVGIWLGEEYVVENVLLIAILANVYYNIVSTPIFTFKSATGLYNQVKYIVLVCSLINVAISIFLGNIMGTSGIIFATIISKGITLFWYEPRILYKMQFDRKSWDYFREFALGVVVLLAAIGICQLAVGRMQITGIFMWIVKACICGVITLVVYALCYGWRPEMKFIISKFVNMKNR